MLERICFCIALFCIALFSVTIIFKISKHIKNKKRHAILVANGKFPSNINNILFVINRFSLVFLFFSGFGSSVSLYAAFSGNWDWNLALEFCLFVCLPISVLFAFFSLLSLSKWNCWVFDKSCFYKSNMNLKYEYNEILHADIYCSQSKGHVRWFVKIETENRTITVCVHNKYVENIRHLLSGCLLHNEHSDV